MNKFTIVFLSLFVFACFSADAVYKLVKLQDKNAVCLDGSPGAYYISQTGDPKKIYLQFQGGGWCGQIDLPSTLQSCYQRSKNYYGSSKDYSQTKIMNQGTLSIDTNNNFKDWTRVLLLYCDGSGHQGTRKEPVIYKDAKLYFRGHNVTVAQLQSLQEKVKLFSGATEVVVGGDSAGGLAVYFWANYVAEKVKSGKVTALPDSGIFIDTLNVKLNRPFYRQTLVNLMKISNVQIDIPVPECIQDNKNEKVNCFFAQNLHKYIKIPQFAIQSLYDTWSIDNILGISCIQDGSLAKCTDEEVRVIEEYHRNTTNVLFEIGSNNKNGFWAPVCANHVYGRGERYFSPDYRIPQNSDNSASYCVQNWLSGKTQQNKFIDLNVWPSNKPCSITKQQNNIKKLMFQQ